MIKWVVATLGALIVVFGAFLGVMLIPAVLFPVIYESMAGLVIMYMIGVPLSISAGVMSFRATLRQYESTKQ